MGNVVPDSTGAKGGSRAEEKIGEPWEKQLQITAGLGGSISTNKKREDVFFFPHGQIDALVLSVTRDFSSGQVGPLCAVLPVSNGLLEKK